MGTAAEFLGARLSEVGDAIFELGEEIHGAFGGVFGGAVAAACLMAARPAALGRRPFSLHTTFVRGLATPTCRASVEVVNSGRTISTVVVDLHDEAGKLAARSTATFAAPEALSPQAHPGRVAAPELSEFDEGATISFGGPKQAPIVAILEPRMVGQPSGGYAHAVRIPWDADPATSAEAACMAADFCVGIPVGSALSEFVPMPNPDLSLRFLGEESDDVMIGVGRLARLDAGVAGTQVEVWTGSGTIVAIGLSSTVLLGGASRAPAR